MAANLGQGRRTTISFLKDSWFQAGVEDFLAGLPPNQRALDERSVAEALAYEYGRLFAAHCTALGRLVPCLPRRGDGERDCRDAPHELPPRAVRRTKQLPEAVSELETSCDNRVRPRPSGNITLEGGRIGMGH